MSTVGSPHFIYIYRNILSIAKTLFVGTRDESSRARIDPSKARKQKGV
jgi:hypothetical protein